MKLIQDLKRTFRRRPAPPRRPVQTTLKATAAARRDSLDDYDAPEPTTNLSTAFVIVLLLHVVAVVGIYIFNHIKSTRPPAPTPIATTSSAKTAKSKPAPAVAKTAPTEAPTQKPAAVAQTEKPAPPARLLPSGVRVHRVQPNENLTRIATIYAVTVADLEAANNLTSKSILQVDQMLNIPAQTGVTRQPATVPARLEPSPKKIIEAPKPAPAVAKTTTPAKPATRTYTVDKGDTVTYIAKRFGVSADQLVKLNNISDPKKLAAGKSLKIPAKSN